MDQRLGSIGRECGATGIRAMDDLAQFIGRNILEQIADGSSLQRALNRDLLFETHHRDHDLVFPVPKSNRDTNFIMHRRFM
jgi:hypothetical protein